MIAVRGLLFSVVLALSVVASCTDSPRTVAELPGPPRIRLQRLGRRVHGPTSDGFGGSFTDWELSFEVERAGQWDAFFVHAFVGDVLARTKRWTLVAAGDGAARRAPRRWSGDPSRAEALEELAARQTR
jgi:hypothetical protein